MLNFWEVAETWRKVVTHRQRHRRSYIFLVEEYDPTSRQSAVNQKTQTCH